MHEEETFGVPYEVKLQYFPHLPIRIKMLPNGQMTLSGRNSIQEKGWGIGVKKEVLADPDLLARFIVKHVGKGIIAPIDLLQPQPLPDQGEFLGIANVQPDTLRPFWESFAEKMKLYLGSAVSPNGT